MPQTQEVRASLGCGTLILIAIIVIIFNGHQDHDNLENKVDTLENKVDELLLEVREIKQEVLTLRKEI